MRRGQEVGAKMMCRNNANVGGGKGCLGKRKSLYFKKFFLSRIDIKGYRVYDVFLLLSMSRCMHVCMLGGLRKVKSLI